MSKPLHYVTIALMSEKLRLRQTLFCLFAVSVVINLDRLLLGENCPIRRIDITDVYLSKIQYLGRFWHHPFDFAWNAATFRGWPSFLESIQPQHLCCLLASFLPATLSFTIFQVLQDALILVGTYMFFYNFLGFRHLTALYGAMYNCALIYWFNENPYVTQVSYIPLIVAVTSVGVRPIGGVLRWVSLVLVFLTTFPPYTVPVSPFVHLMCVAFLSDKNRRWQNVKYGLLLWGIFAITYFPNLWGYFINWPVSNRTLWHEASGAFRWPAFVNHLRHMDFWYPPIAAIATYNFLRDWKSRLLVATIFLILFVISQTGYWYGFPVLKMTAFAGAACITSLHFCWPSYLPI